jgi:hypothetical protein
LQIDAKNKQKASEYMADLTNKDKLLQQTRLKVFEQEEEMKKLHLMRDKLILERSHIL